jgi:hypothetical protein
MAFSSGGNWNIHTLVLDLEDDVVRNSTPRPTFTFTFLPRGGWIRDLLVKGRIVWVSTLTLLSGYQKAIQLHSNDTDHLICIAKIIW